MTAQTNFAFASFLGDSANKLEFLMKVVDPFRSMEPQQRDRLRDTYAAGLRRMAEEGSPVQQDVRLAAGKCDLPEVVRTVMGWYATRRPELAADPWWNQLAELSPELALAAGMVEWQKYATAAQ